MIRRGAVVGAQVHLLPAALVAEGTAVGASAIPDAKTVWLFREQLTRAGAVERLFRLFDSALRDAGYLAMGGQIVDATIVQARRPRLSKDEKAAVKEGAAPDGWSKADGHRWALDP